VKSTTHSSFGRGEVALDQVRRASSSLVGDRGPHPTSAPNPLHTAVFINRSIVQRATGEPSTVTPSRRSWW